MEKKLQMIILLQYLYTIIIKIFSNIASNAFQIFDQVQCNLFLFSKVRNTCANHQVILGKS